MARRSVLFTPGDRPSMLRKAAGSDADVVVFDLEDAVAPERKAEGRDAVGAVLSDPEFAPDAEVCVRVNPDEDTMDADLDAVLGDWPGPDAVMLPKVDGADDVDTLAGSLADRDADLPAFALVETARGVSNAEGVADHPATDAVAFGAEDLAADLGATRTAEGTEVLYARQRVVTAAAAAGVDAIDTLHTDVEDREALREDAEFARRLGYDGKMAIHPAQVGVINEAYTPDRTRVEWARKVLAARDEARAAGRGVFRVDDEMVDAPLVAQAEQVIERARAAGLLGDSNPGE